MVRLTVVNSGTLKRKLKLVTYTGLIVVASYAALKGISKAAGYLDNNVKKNQIEELIDKGYYDDARKSIALYENNGGLNPVLIVELKKNLDSSMVQYKRKSQLEKLASEKKALEAKLELQRKALVMKKDSVSATIDSLITNGKLGDAECVLTQFEKLYTKPQIDSITKIITENSEPYIYSMTKDSAKGQSFSDMYLDKFAHGPHRKELITALLNHSLNDVIDLMNKSSNASDVSKLLNNYKKNLDQFKSEGVILLSNIRDNLVRTSDAYVTSPEFVSQYDISKISKDMSVMVTKGVEEKFNELYVKERSKNVSAGTVGTVFSYNDMDNVVFVKFDKNCAWSRDWNFVSQYWTETKKNVVAYSASELLYSKAGQKKAVISKGLSDVLSLLDKYYSGKGK
jgi:hypothetical protein